MDTQIDRYLSRIAKAAQALGIPKYRLAKECNLHPNTLTLIGSPDWKPAIGTLRRLEKVLFPADTPAMSQCDVGSQ